MPKYHFSCTFTYGGAPVAIHRSVARWFQDLGDAVTVNFRSANDAGVPPVEYFQEALAAATEDAVWLKFQVNGPGGTGNGTLAIATPSDTPQPSRLELQFSINAKSQGLFASGEQVRRALLSAAVTFDAESGQVEADDFSDAESSRKYAVFQAIRDRRVPVSFEWVTVVRASTFRAIGWNLASLEGIPGIRSGEEEGYVWILLSDAPFSYKAGVGTGAQRRVEDALDLRAKQQPG